MVEMTAGWMKKNKKIKSFLRLQAAERVNSHYFTGQLAKVTRKHARELCNTN